MKDKKEELKKGCGHVGKWSGNGQSVINAGNVLIIITSAVCGECGNPIISINNLKINGLKPKFIAPSLKKKS